MEKRLLPCLGNRPSQRLRALDGEGVSSQLPCTARFGPTARTNSRILTISFAGYTMLGLLYLLTMFRDTSQFPPLVSILQLRALALTAGEGNCQRGQKLRMTRHTVAMVALGCTECTRIALTTL